MPSDLEANTNRPIFPAYLLPSVFTALPHPRRRRNSSTKSAQISDDSVSATNSSPISSKLLFSSPSTFISYASPTSTLFPSSSLSASPSSTSWSPITTPSSSPFRHESGYFEFGRTHSIAYETLQAQVDRTKNNRNSSDGEVQQRSSILNGEESGPRVVRKWPDTLRCSTCATDIAFASQIVSKGFTGRHGRAYLVAAAPRERCLYSARFSAAEWPEGELLNTRTGRPVNRQLVTGAHVVADISCVICGEVVGWKYVDAKEASQRYKIGKFILETRRVVGWRGLEDGFGGENDDGEHDGRIAVVGRRGAESVEEDVIVFDSDDEDECEDLFMGVWDGDSVRKRRSRKLKKGHRGEA